MRRWMNFFIVAALCLTHTVVFAGSAASEYKQARMDYVSAMVCLASYSDRVGLIARDGLNRSGWHMEPYKKSFRNIDARFYLTENTKIEPGSKIYILAIAGTENKKDIAVDLNFSKVLFGGATPEEFDGVAQTKELTSQDPMVHRGFNQYTQVAFFTREEDGGTYGEYIADVLRREENSKLYIVGHSLGGAVATLGAARLVSLGVDPAKIKVVTFGAPAVGNQSFAEQYGQDLNLDRIVVKNDPVADILQSISGGYVQFGKKKVWREDSHINQENHEIVVYLDTAMRKYYDALKALHQEGLRADDEEAHTRLGASTAYVAPIRTILTDDLREDAFYFKSVIKDSLKDDLKAYVLSTEEERGTFAQELEKARQASADWMLFPTVTVEKVQKMKNTYYVSYVEPIYSVKEEKMVGTLYYSSGTREFTPIQAALYNTMSAEEERNTIFNRAQ